MNNSPKITVQSSDIQLGQAFVASAEAAILETGAKYFDHLVSAAVHVHRDGEAFCCSILLHVGAFPEIAGEAQDRDCFAAFNHALGKAAKQLRRKKRELRDHKVSRGSVKLAAEM